MLRNIGVRAFKDLPAWWAILATLLLPAMSYSGYPPHSLAYLSVLSGAAVAALPLAILGRVPVLGNLALVASVSFIVLAYFHPYLLPYGWPAFAAGALATVGLLILLVRDRRVAVLTIAIGCGSQVVAAAFSTSPHVLSDLRNEVARTDLPPIIHIILDEYPGLDAIPHDAKLSELRNTLESQYLKAGFTLFPKAYSAENATQLSLTRLFNRDVEKPADFLKLVPEKARWEIGRAELLDKIGERRALELTHLDYAVFSSEIRSQPHVARATMINTHSYYPGTSQVKLSPLSRVQIAVSAALHWLYSQSRVPPVVWLLEQTQFGKQVFDWIFIPRYPFPMVARQAFFKFARDLDCCAQRGTYYFIHTYFPHHPYMFDRKCNVRAPNDWTAPWTRPIEREDTDPHYQYIGLYRDILEQALCANETVLSLVAALDRNPATKDAIVIIHGDHGSRITMKRAEGAAHGYTEQREWLDQHATFLAIRWPDKMPRIEPEAIRIDAALAALVEHDFQRSGINAVRRYDDQIAD